MSKIYFDRTKLEEKTSLVDDDYFLVNDSADGDKTKFVYNKNLVGGLPFGGTYANYSALPVATLNPQTLFYVIASQGTKWLPFSFGGTYYPSGWYYSDGSAYSFQETPHQASQSDTNAGVVTDQFVSPSTLKNYNGISESNIILTDIETGNSSTTKHGWFPKLPTALGKFLRDDMTWQTVITSLSSAIGITQLAAQLIGTVDMAANDINWNAGVHFICSSSGEVTLTQSNHTSNVNKGIVVKVPNATSVNYPSGWVLKTGADTLDSTSSIFAYNENGTIIYTIRNNA